jgi:hypothetical protein
MKPTQVCPNRRPSANRLAPLFACGLALILAWLLLSESTVAATPSKVAFNNEGVVLVDDKPFFPIGVFTYDITPEVLAELREVQANTVLNGFRPEQLDLLHEHGLMAVCPPAPEWVKAAKEHPALLAWYLTDEPENRNVTPEAEQKNYSNLKAQDANHPIGLCHTSFEALTKYKDACDFTMTDIYPISAQRDKNIMGVSLMMDEARRIHGQVWPQWTDIQTFGGSDTDAGVWAVPLPHEVRFMTYQALVHRATGILYFSYWPRQPRMWQSLAPLNAEIHRLIPRLVAPGKDEMLKADNEAVQTRVRTLTVDDPAKAAGLIIAINTSPKFVQTTIHLDRDLTDLSVPFEQRTAKPSTERAISERFAPYGVHVYLWGPEPQISLAREN